MYKAEVDGWPAVNLLGLVDDGGRVCVTIDRETENSTPQEDAWHVINSGTTDCATCEAQNP